MPIEAKVILDSVTPRGHRPIEQGYRLTTVEVTIPRIVLAEFNTHRVFSRNSASSRAIPVEKQIEKVLTDPFIPTEFGSNKSGMQAGEPLTGDDRAQAIFAWLDARDAAVSQARKMLDLGVHKQITNRLLEPFMYHTIICSSTEWDNFFAQRCSPLAQPEIRLAAEAIREARAASTPQRRVFIDDPHLPYLRPEDDELRPSHRIKVSVARCARVSYETHDGIQDPEKDIDLYNKLISAEPPHWSPLEHVGFVGRNTLRSRSMWGNFQGWEQLRHIVGNGLDPRSYVELGFLD